MDQHDVTDFILYREQHKTRQPSKKDIYTDELITAIQSLIQRLRDKNPIKEVS